MLVNTELHSPRFRSDTPLGTDIAFAGALQRDGDIASVLRAESLEGASFAKTSQVNGLADLLASRVRASDLRGMAPALPCGVTGREFSTSYAHPPPATAARARSARC